MADEHDYLVAACREGSREAFRALFEAYKDRVWAIALSFFGGDEASARDASQEVFLKLLTKIRDFRGEAKFSTWLYRFVANACLDEHRRRRRLVPIGDEKTFPAQVKDDVEAKSLRRETEGKVQAALTALSPKLRLVVLMKYFEGLSYEEMAESLGCSVGTVASRLHRGHQILARRLEPLRSALSSGE